MSFRTVVITNKAKLNYKNRYLVVKKELEEKYIHLSEIDTLIIDSIAVSISSYLLKELLDNKINVMFCDEKHNPYSELKPLNARHNSSKKILEQIKWKAKKKDALWQNIVINKIRNQMRLLKKTKSEGEDLLCEYMYDVKIGDKTNREGHAAKVYFYALFGKKFTRNKVCDVNAALNYGYNVLLSTFNKEVVCNGYLTQIGIHHKNEFNEFNLSCDLMEPFRVIIDNFVYHNLDREFDQQYKLDLVNIFNNTYLYKKKKYTLKDIIRLYTQDILQSLTTDSKYGEFIYEE